jgi:S-formylglutathione hydrolase
MTQTRLDRFELVAENHAALPAVVVAPAQTDRALPLCLFLYGGSGSSESLADIQPLLEAWFTSGALPPLLVATLDVGPWSFYLDDATRGLNWETLVAEHFVAQLRASFDVIPEPAATGLVGISMGGYGALKIAIARPHAFAAVAALSPMIEPALEAAEVRPRNRYHYPPEVPQALLGPERDAALYRADHPAARAVRNADSLRTSGLGVYIDAASMDALHAHDGAEHLHRVLWELDIAHEYRLRRDADHIGPGFIERLCEAFIWVATRIGSQSELPLTDDERAWESWLAGRLAAAPSVVLAPTSRLFPRLLRAQLSAARREAELHDPSFGRRYGVLPAFGSVAGNR